MRNWELRDAVVDVLKAHVGLTALLAEDPRFAGVAAVYDHVPQSAEFPYVTIGTVSGDEHDADDISGQDLEVTVNAFSRYRGLKEIEQIGRQVDDALHRTTPTVTNAKVVTFHRETSEAVLDPDGLTRHGIQRYRVILEES